MAKFILKDQRGNEQEFDHDKIFVMGTDGELLQFTQGEGDTPAVVQPLEVTENGTYTAPDGVDGFSQVVVNVDPTWKNILVKDEIGGFAFDSTFGAYSPGYVAPAAFALEVGKTYRVHWDGTDYECIAFGFTNQGSEIAAIGNGSSLGLQGNGEPFLITCNITYNNTQLFATDTKESHVVGIWEKVVQEITLQDKTITENGEYTADEGFDGLGKVLVEVAAGGGGSFILQQGSFVASALKHTLEHGLGVTPALFHVISITRVETTRKMTSAFGISSAFGEKVGNPRYKSYFNYTYKSGSDLYVYGSRPEQYIDTTETYPITVIHHADANTITVGNSNYDLVSGNTYYWIAIGIPE